MNIKTKLMLYIVILCIGSRESFGWFSPSGGGGAIAITRANQYNTSTFQSPWNIRNTADIYKPTFFDYGESGYIPDNIAGRVKTPFYCGYPLTFDIWMSPHSSSVANYSEVTLEYFQGTNSLNSLDWVTIGKITQFQTVEGIEGAHFGTLNWIPPNTTNEYYLIRIFGVLDNGIQSASKLAKNIDKDGGSGWYDSQVVLIRAADVMVPGYVIQEDIPKNEVVKIEKVGIFTKYMRKLKSLFKGNK
jgi:hypothetical protein